MAYDAALGYDPANIMKSINDAVAKGDDAEVERLSVERYKKLRADPVLLAKYGTDAASQVAQNVLKRPVDTTVGGALTSSNTPAGAPTYPTYPTAPTPTPSADTGTYKSFDDVLKWIDTLNNAQKEGAINSLGQARDKANASLTAERSALAPAYYDSRNQISAQGSQARAGMDEYLAQAGLTSSGAQGALQTRLVGQEQGALGASQTSEAQAIADILRRQQGVEQDYQYGVSNANNQSEVNRIQQQIDQNNNNRQYGLQEAGLTGNLNGSPTMQALQYQQDQLNATYQREVNQYQSQIDQTNYDQKYQQDQTNYDTQVGLQSAAYTGVLNGQPTVQATAAATEQANAEKQRQIDTIPQFDNDYQKEINRIAATPDTADDWIIPYIKMARSAKIAAQASQESAQAADTYDKAMKQFEQLGVADGWVATALGLTPGTKSMDYSKTLYEIQKPYYNPYHAPSSGGGTKKDTSTAGMGTAAQVGEYYSTLNSYITGTTGRNDPEGAYGAALGVKGDLVKIMGEKLTNQLLADLKGRATTVGQPKEDPGYNYKTDPNYINDISQANAGGLSSDEIKGDAAQITRDYGPDGYGKILAAAVAFEE